MPTRLHTHDHAGRGHPPAAISPSILRMSVLQRLSISGLLIVLLWSAVMWAIR